MKNNRKNQKMTLWRCVACQKNGK